MFRLYFRLLIYGLGKLQVLIGDDETFYGMMVLSALQT